MGGISIIYCKLLPFNLIDVQFVLPINCFKCLNSPYSVLDVSSNHFFRNCSN